MLFYSPSVQSFHLFVQNSVLTGCLFCSSQYGVYNPNCGLDKVTMSWGHDGGLLEELCLNKFAFSRLKVTS